MAKQTKTKFSCLMILIRIIFRPNMLRYKFANI